MQTKFGEMYRLPIVEIFKSIEGEGVRTGLPTVFVRFAVCNLNCAWCDTNYSHKLSDATEHLSKEELVSRILVLKCKRITFTGGEPLERGGDFIKWFATNYPDFDINIETNGSKDLSSYTEYDNVMFTVDYKCPSSGMTGKMNLATFKQLRNRDVVKFVVADDVDLQTVLDVMYNKTPTTKQIYLHPVFGQMDLIKLAEFVINYDFLDLRIGIQIHKIIWDPNKRGV